MKKVVEFLQENPVQYLATVGRDGKAKCRPFMFCLEKDGKLWFCTNNTKDVYKDMLANPEIEISVSSPSYAWIRLAGKAVFENNMEVKEDCMKAGFEATHTPLHKTLLSMLDGKKIFCLSTNADGQFEKAGLCAEKIFCTQGDYFHIQCAKGCHPKRYDARELFRQMDAARKDCLIPSDMVPQCPVCGGRMNMNLRIDQYFVQDEEWYIAEKRFGDFLSEAISSGRKTCLLELGVGFNTPTIIRFPFEKLTRENEQISLVRLNLNEAVIPEHFGARAVGINVDMQQSIEDIALLQR